MSFDIIFDIVEEPMKQQAEFGELSPVSEPDDVIKKKIIVAHQALMTLSEDNKMEFQDLVSALKRN